MFTFAEFINEKYSLSDSTTSYLKLIKKSGGIQKTQKAAVNEIIAFLSTQLPHLSQRARREVENFLSIISKFK